MLLKNINNSLIVFYISVMIFLSRQSVSSYCIISGKPRGMEDPRTV